MSKHGRQISLPGFEMGDDGPNTAADAPPADAAANPPTPPPAPTVPASGSTLDCACRAERAATPPSSQTVWVIDAHSLIHQVFHALPEMTSPTGEPVGAVFGFTRDLLHLLVEKHPDYLFCAFDLPGGTFRHAMYEEYKVQREEMPDLLVPQIPAIRRVLETLGIPALDCPSFEADDVLATVARLAEQRGSSCYLVTSDKDVRQLITNRVLVYNIRKDEIIDAARLEADWGIRPDQVVDYQALVGDAVDNVPGVPLIGPKFARQLLEQYDTLEAILEHAGDVAGAKRRENLQKYRDQALLSRDLVRLDANVPLEIDWDAWRAGQIDRAAAQKLFDDFGFRSMGQKLDAVLAVLR